MVQLHVHSHASVMNWHTFSLKRNPIILEMKLAHVVLFLVSENPLHAIRRMSCWEHWDLLHSCNICLQNEQLFQYRTVSHK